MFYTSIYPYNISIKIKSFDIHQLQKICAYVKKMCTIFGAQSITVTFLPLKKKHISICRSPHIHKKARTQLVYKRYKVIFSFGVYNFKCLQEILFFFKTSYLPGVEYELCVSEKAFVL